MFAFLFMTAVAVSTVAGEESSCEFRDVRTLFANLVAANKDLETMIEENKNSILEEVKQMKNNITHQATEIKTLEVNRLETSTKFDEVFLNLTVLIEAKDTEINEMLDEIVQNVTAVTRDLNNLFSVTDGGWSFWSNWSECPVTCLGGLTRRTRTCNNPEPSRYGRGCVGNNEEVNICNSVICPDVDDCIGHLCKNGATCVDGVYNYMCVCATGFTGEKCETHNYMTTWNCDKIWTSFALIKLLSRL